MNSEPTEHTLGHRFAAWVFDHPRLVLLAASLFILLMGCGVTGVSQATGYRIYFTDDNPDLMAMERFEVTYSGIDSVAIVIHTEEGDLFSREAASAIEEITELAWQMPHVRRVNSITNFQHSWADGDVLTVEDLIQGASNLSEEDLSRSRAIALNEPLLAGKLISPDARTTIIAVAINLPPDIGQAQAEVAAAARALVSDLEVRFPNLRYALSGSIMLGQAYSDAKAIITRQLFPMMFFAIGVVVVVSLQSFSAGALALATAVSASLCGVGFGGWFDAEWSSVSSTTPMIIIALAIAGCIHLFNAIFSNMRSGFDKRESVIKAITSNIFALSLTGATTATAFLSYLVMDSPPYHHLGLMTAAGIASALILTLTALPAAVSLLPIRAKQENWQSRLIQRLFLWFPEIVIRYRIVILIVAALSSIICVSALPKLEFVDRYVENFDQRIAFRRDSDFMREHISGAYRMEFSLNSGRSGGVNTPSYLLALDRFSNWLEEHEAVQSVSSYIPIIKRLNMNLHGDDRDWYKIPENPDEAAQYLFLYEMSLPYGLDLTDRITLDKSASRMTVILRNIDSKEFRLFLEQADTWINNEEAIASSDIVGTLLMYDRMSERILSSLKLGGGAALVIIACLLCIAFRSIPLGLFSLIPNVLPILMALGLWYYIYGSGTWALLGVFIIALGIVVDDSIFYITKYIRARRLHRLSPEDAVRYAHRNVGPAMLYTTITLVISYGALATSPSSLTADAALANMIALALALTFDLLALPAALLVGDQWMNWAGLKKGAKP
jgi:predicted RND superfamily exporter protein